MPGDRTAVLPPTDHVARVLLSRGAREHAVALLEAAVVRDPGEKACAALLRAIEARPDAAVYVPDVVLDRELVAAYCRRGMLVEALAVLRGTELGMREGHGELVMLEELLAPDMSGDDPVMQEVASQLHAGSATVAFSMLDDRMSAGETLSPRARRARDVLHRLMLSSADSADARVQPLASSTPFELRVGKFLAARDLRGAAEEAKRVAAEWPTDTTAAVASVALQRLVLAVESAEKDIEAAGAAKATMPMSGAAIALLHMRMGNLDESERTLRRLLAEDPSAVELRDRIRDLEAVRYARMDRLSIADYDDEATTSYKPVKLVDPLAGTTQQRENRDGPDAHAATAEVSVGVAQGGGPALLMSPSPPIAMPNVDPLSATASAQAAKVEASAQLTPMPRESSSPRSVVPVEIAPDLLRKKARAPQGEYGAHGSAFDVEPATQELRQDLEAELLLKQGYAERALVIYERLAADWPDSVSYARRAAEIRDLIERDRVPVPAEITVRRHIPEVAEGGRDLDGETDIAEDTEIDNGRRGLSLTSTTDAKPLPSMGTGVRASNTRAGDGSVRVRQIIVVG